MNNMALKSLPKLFGTTLSIPFYSTPLHSQPALSNIIHLIYIIMQDLSSTDRSLTPWVIVMFHCPWHNSNLSHQTERQAMTAMRTMEPLLFEHKTALVISGHVHGETHLDLHML